MITKRLTIKRLTPSDLTFFTWHFKAHPAGNQKAINLNANVFVGKLYPMISEAEPSKTGRIPIDLYIFGPGLQPELNVQRKIIKGTGYKNWRLNGEFVDDVENPERFSQLTAGDFVVLEFEGDIYPISARAVFIGMGIAEDRDLFTALDQKLAGRSMIAVDTSELNALIEAAKPLAEHPINELALDEALEDVALGGSSGVRKLLRRRSGARLSRGQLLQSREKADEVGRRGEEILDFYFQQLARFHQITKYEWTSNDNAVSPYDFIIWDDAKKALIDAKSTSGNFERNIHISFAELLEMAQASERYDLYRIYEIREDGAKLRVAPDVRGFAAEIVNALQSLPVGVSSDSVSVSPTLLSFGEPIEIVIDREEE